MPLPLIKNKSPPWPGGSVGWSVIPKSERSLVQSRSGHMPRLQVRALVRARVGGRQPISLSLTLMCVGGEGGSGAAPRGAGRAEGLARARLRKADSVWHPDPLKRVRCAFCPPHHAS